MARREIRQIAAGAAEGEDTVTIYALAEDGSLWEGWRRSDAAEQFVWRAIPPLPEGK